jgi:glycosyltransferase involved in cell wall biosynthesis
MKNINYIIDGKIKNCVKRSEFKRLALDGELRHKISVIIPFFNGSKYIERAVKSVLNQSIKPDELIIVDDGSAPAESEYLDLLNRKYDFIIIHKKNGGQGSARNAGVEAANGDFVCFLDQDDFYLIDHIKILYGSINFKDTYFGAAYGDLREADGDGNIIRDGMIKLHSIHPKNDIFTLIREDMFILPSASIINKSAFKAIGGFDELFMGYEDDDFFMRLYERGYSLNFIDKAVTVWCIHAESTSYSIKMSRSRFLYFKKLYFKFPDEKEKNRYYLRDLLLPRFHPLMWSDVKKAIRNFDKKNIAELAKIYSEFVSIAITNNYVKISDKIFLIARNSFIKLIRLFIL